MSVIFTSRCPIYTYTVTGPSAGPMDMATDIIGKFVAVQVVSLSGYEWRRHECSTEREAVSWAIKQRNAVCPRKARKNG